MVLHPNAFLTSILWVIAVCLSPTIGFAQPRIDPLEFWPSGVSGDGRMVVGTGYRDGGNEPVLWQAGNIEYLGKLGGDHTYAQNISADGSVVIAYDYSSVGYRWTRSSGYEHLAFTNIPYDLTADGSVVVGYTTGVPTENEVYNGGASRWTALDGTTVLGDFHNGGGETVSALSVTPSGNVIVGFGYRDSTGVPEAFRWTPAEGTVGLGDLPGDSVESQALDISPDGSIVVGYGTSDTGHEAFRWTAATGMQGLGHLPGHVDSQFVWSSAQAIAPDGSFILGQDSIAAYESVAFYWDAAGGMRPLAQVLQGEFGIDTTGWQLDSVTALSADGSTIIGMGRHTDYPNPVGWRAVLVPEPSSALIAAISTIALVLGCRYRRAYASCETSMPQQPC
jgi:probable HAF family extracellular repeat protein